MAKRYRGRGVPLEDLVNEGNLGLMRAAEKFDERHGVRFVTYAAWWVRRAMLAALSSNAPTGEPGPGGRSARARPGRVRAPAASPAERLRFVSLEDPERGRALGELLADPRAADPDRSLEREALRDVLDAGLAFLPGREERVLRGYFGLDGDPPRPLRQIGRELGVSGERARQLKDRALDRLRAGPLAGRLQAHRR